MGVMAQANNTGATHFLQYGALAALSPQGDAFRGELLARCAKGRDVVADFIDGQNRIRWMKPDGAFYGFLHVDGLKDSLAFAQEMVRTASRRGAGLGLRPGRSARRGLSAHLFCPGCGRLAQGLSSIGNSEALSIA